jgi:uncharacterized protein YeaO (DUF488 family)
MRWLGLFMIRTKCVHSPMEREKDGLRILAARFRGRGMKADRYDVWMPNLGPSEELLHDFIGGRISWAVFGRRYRKELVEDGSVDLRNATIKNHGQKFTLRLLRELGRRGNVTVMCHCTEDTEHCHRFLLQRCLEQKG